MIIHQILEYVPLSLSLTHSHTHTQKYAQAHDNIKQKNPHPLHACVTKIHAVRIRNTKTNLQ